MTQLAGCCLTSSLNAGHHAISGITSSARSSPTPTDSVSRSTAAADRASVQTRAPTSAREAAFRGWYRYLPVRPVSATGLTFVSDERVSELRTLQIHSFDLGRLIRLCEELNVSVPRGLLPCDGHAVACAARPCAAGVWQRTFAEVANNVGSKSFNESMQHLENGARKIADAHLHTPIRKREALPTAQQVALGPELDVLLAELIRLSGHHTAV